MGKIKKYLLFSVALLFTVGVAYILGATAAGIVQDYRADKKRAEITRSILDRMGAGLGVGVTLPDTRLITSEGDTVFLGGLVQERSLVSFVTPDCRACKILFERYRSLLSHSTDQSRFILISTADPLVLSDLRRQFCPECLFLHDPSGGYISEIGVISFPFSFVVDERLTIVDIISGVPDESSIEEVAEFSDRAGE